MTHVCAQSASSESPSATPEESYQERQDRRTREHARAFDQLCRGIEEHLPGWTLRSAGEPEDDWLRRFDGPREGMVLILTWRTGAEKAEARGELPRTVQGHRPRISVGPSELTIGFSPSRGARAVARDLERKLLSPYTRAFAETAEQVEADRLYHHQAEEHLVRLARIAGKRVEADPARRPHQVHLPEGRGVIKTSGPSKSSEAQATLEIRLPIPLAEAVLELVYDRLG